VTLAKNEAMYDLLELLKRDLKTARVSGDLGIFSAVDKIWVQGTGEGHPNGFEGDYVLALPGRLHGIAASRDGGPSAVEVMSEVQDWVIDEVGHGWPELLDQSGEYLAILQPVSSDEHRAVWSGGGVKIPLGSLADWRGRIHS